MKATDYHNQAKEFTVGMTVNHVADTGYISTATIKDIADELLLLYFSDGDEGWERPDSCYVGESAPSPRDPRCTCHLAGDQVGPVPHYCPTCDGDYMSFLASCNCD